MGSRDMGSLLTEALWFEMILVLIPQGHAWPSPGFGLDRGSQVTLLSAADLAQQPLNSYPAPFACCFGVLGRGESW